MGSPSLLDEHNGKTFDSIPLDMSDVRSPLTPPATSTDPSLESALDGGTLAWFQVAGCFFVLMNTWGIINTFGAYQGFYETHLLRSHTPSAISWIGSIQGYLLFLVGALTGPFFDAGYNRALLAIGSFFIFLGLMMTSLVKQYYQAFLAQGVCFGIGAGMLFVPSIAVVSTYFDKYRSFSVGIAVTGSGLGGVIYPILFHSLQPRVGFDWATRIIAFIALVTLGITNLVMRQRVLPATCRKLFDVSALREAPFMLCTAGLFFGFAALYIPFFYITPYALFKTGASKTLAFYFVPILNASSVFGRIFPNALADRIGTFNTLIPCTLACGGIAFAWMSVDDTGDLFMFAVLYGFFSGSFVSLAPTTIVSLSNDLHKVGTRLGMSFSISGFGILIGTPVAGTLLNLQTGDFVHAQVFCAASMMASWVCLVLARFAKTGPIVVIKG